MRAWVMVGAPGSGKSSLAKALAKQENAVIVSFDNIRAKLFGSVEIQGPWDQIWEQFEEDVSESCGCDLIIDGTHCKADYRADVVSLLTTFGYDRVRAVVLNVSLEVCLKQNNSRERHVPEHVIKQMHRDLQESLDKIELEKFEHVHFASTVKGPEGLKFTLV